MDLPSHNPAYAFETNGQAVGWALPTFCLRHRGL